MVNFNKNQIDKIPRLLIFNSFYILFFIIIIIFSIITEKFATVSNLNTILLHSAPLFIISIGMTFVLIAGSLDISIGSIAFSSAAVGLFAFQIWGVNTLLSILIILFTSTLLGFINGLIIVKLKMNALIVSLGMMITLRGVGLLITSGRQYPAPPAITDFGIKSIGPVYMEAIIAILISIILQIILSKTTFGKFAFAVGSNEKSAKTIGINVDLIRILAFIISGFFSGIGAIFMISQTGVVQAAMGQDTPFLALTAILIGGASLSGGRGSIIPGTLFGVIILIVIENGLNYMGASPYIYPFIRGLILFVAMFFDSFKYSGFFKLKSI